MLTNEQIKSYEENGYVLVKDFFTSDQTTTAGDWLRNQDQESLAKTFTDQEPGVKLAVYQNVLNEESPISKLANDERVLRLASELMGDETYIWSSKVNLKAAWCGTVEYYHQDYAYWKGRGYDNLEMLTCMIFVDDHSVNNGGLHVVEDVHTSYQKHYGNPYKFSFINFSKKIIDDINFTFPGLDKFNYSINDQVYSVEFFESIVAFKIDRNLCYTNKLIENNGISSNNLDVTIDQKIFNFRKKFKFLYKFKIVKKLERIYIRYLYKKNSNNLKSFFK